MSPSAKVLAMRAAFPPPVKSQPITCIGCGEGAAWKGVDLHLKKILIPIIGSTEAITEYRHGNKQVCDAIKKTRRTGAKPPVQLVDPSGAPL